MRGKLDVMSQFAVCDRHRCSPTVASSSQVVSQVCRKFSRVRRDAVDQLVGGAFADQHAIPDQCVEVAL